MVEGGMSVDFVIEEIAAAMARSKIEDCEMSVRQELYMYTERSSDLVQVRIVVELTARAGSNVRAWKFDATPPSKRGEHYEAALAMYRAGLDRALLGPPWAAE